MKVTFYGTRGSVPIANKASVATGGNTTCLRIESDCLPQGMWLVVDAGSGIVPLAMDALKNQVKSVAVFFTHYHWDHTQGLPLAPIAFIKTIPIACYGPVDDGVGPKEMLEASMRRPFFPVDFSEVGSHFTCHRIEHPSPQVIIIHPKGGIKKMTLDQFERFDGKPLPIGRQGEKYPKSECLVIKMMRSSHPEMTISYRFEEGPTGKVFVFLTDNENLYATPNAMKVFLRAADFLAMDSQYPEQKYVTQTAGFGHGTAANCVRVALEAGVKKLGLTHHDPLSTDSAVQAILEEGKAALQEFLKGNPKEKPALSAGAIFSCQDYQTVEV